jgi:hypothetical protein
MLEEETYGYDEEKRQEFPTKISQKEAKELV